MAHSANQDRRSSTAHRITVCAQRLTDERGFDGFTMDELAEAAGLSRRTLFNYFPSKADAVLGAGPELDDEFIQEFRGGGPTGDLVEDLGVLIARFLTVTGFDREEAETARRVIRSTPRLHAAAHDRFESIALGFTALLQQREGSGFTEERGRILLTILVALHNVVLDHVLADPTGRLSMGEAYVDALRTARGLLS